MTTGDLFGDVQWEEPVRPRTRPAPRRPPPRRAPPSRRAPPPRARRPPPPRRAPEREWRRRPRPTRRTFIIRRTVALAVLALLVVGLVAAISSLGGGGGGGRQTASKRSRSVAARVTRPVVQRSVLDQLVRADRTLAPGARGEAVRRLQQTLAVLGYSPGAVDGVYADGTRSAVVAFQNAKGIPPGGTVDRPTAVALRRALSQWAATRTTTIRNGLAGAVAAGRLPASAARADRRILTDAVLRLIRLPAPRAGLLSAVLTQVAGETAIYDRPRAAALFGMLDFNARRLTTGPVPTQSGSDASAPDGVVYRFFADKGFQFHPLANFARLNLYVTRHQTGRARRLAAALRARAIPFNHGLVWEYYFPFGGPARWTSALAQSAAAQGLQRAARALRDDGIAGTAKAAFDAIPGRLARPLAGGQWVREYSWSDIAILNAQLQSIVSLNRYARAARDARATAFVQSLSRAAQAELPALDTGNWSRYSIGGSPASVHYHCYHVSLLQHLARLFPKGTVWGQYATRWERYAAARGGCANA